MQKELQNIKDFIIPSQISELAKLFKDNGFGLFIVGGAIRDFLIGKDFKDFDVVTDATPDEMLLFLRKEFGEINEIGKSFGIVAVKLKGLEELVDIASFNTRQGGDIKVGATLEEDAFRRDITFNSLYLDVNTKELIDLTGGIEDLRNNVVRMVGNPVDRIKEDPLRIIRLIKFACALESNIKEEDAQAILELSDLIRKPCEERPNGVSQERIIQEFNSAFKKCRKFSDFIHSITEFELWEELFPNTERSINTYFTETSDITLMWTQLFEHVKVDKFEGKNSISKKEWALSSVNTDTILFFKKMNNLTFDKVIELKKLQKRFSISNDKIREWASFRVFDKLLLNTFLNFSLDIDSKEIMESNNIEHINGKISNSKDGRLLGELINSELIKRVSKLKIKLSINS